MRETDYSSLRNKWKRKAAVWFCVFFVLVFGVFAGQQQEGNTAASPGETDASKQVKEEPGKKTVTNHPPAKTGSQEELRASTFDLERKYWLQPGDFKAIYFRDPSIKLEDIKNVTILLKNFDEDGSLESGKKQSEKRIRKYQLGYSGTDSEKRLRIVIHIPGWKNLSPYLNPSFFDGMLASHKSWLDIKCVVNGKTLEDSFLVGIPNPYWAWILSIFSIILMTWVTWKFINNLRGRNKEDRVSIWKIPLYLANTPRNRFNLSLVQVMIWTYVFLFGLLFVWRMTGAILEVTPQVLLLLGIGGATAAASRVQTSVRLQNIPWRHWELIKSDRTPQLSDLITTPDGTPSIIKFQMLFFTVVIAVKVCADIIATYDFPVISDGMITLMGLSSAVFLGNDMTREVSKDDLKQTIDKIDTKLATPGGIPDPAKDKDVQKFKEQVDAYLQ
ncbi:MAG: hypothetical protein GY940_46165 [bacterium]|nr:hypothetical protein [bacterium]